MTQIGGRWHFEFGDSTPIGWLVFMAYALAAFACLRAARACVAERNRLAICQRGGFAEHRLSRWWFAVAALLAVLAVNKQLDAQTLLTELGRDIAQSQGWYETRHHVQKAFIAVLGLGMAATVAVFMWWLRSVVSRLLVPALGIAVLGFFVLLRAAGFHHVGQAIMPTLDQWGWLLELLGAGLAGYGAWRVAPWRSGSMA